MQKPRFARPQTSRSNGKKVLISDTDLVFAVFRHGGARSEAVQGTVEAHARIPCHVYNRGELST